ncbi:hypothetical protein [Pseudoxanthomonas sp. 10H]|uniref:hypothetical protein n=1 Tax=Pseudoxanthomonas sp. 10H TaxID=3242729 RepID=UPI0035590850
MDAFPEYLHRFWTEMVARSDGPMTFRFFLQPAMALLMALRDGMRDVRRGREPYVVHMRHADPAERKRAWREGVTAVTRILLLGVVMDVIYQFKVFGDFSRPLETLVIAVLLAFIPYLLLRGVVTRVARRIVHR